MMLVLRYMVIITVKRVADSVHGRRGLLRRVFFVLLLLGLWDFCLCNRRMIGPDFSGLFFLLFYDVFQAVGVCML